MTSNIPIVVVECLTTLPSIREVRGSISSRPGYPEAFPLPSSVPPGKFRDRTRPRSSTSFPIRHSISPFHSRYVVQVTETTPLNKLQKITSITLETGRGTETPHRKKLTCSITKCYKGPWANNIISNNCYAIIVKFFTPLT
jgi:hypothetical protein